MKKTSRFCALLSLAVCASAAQANLLEDGSLELADDGTRTSNSAWTVTGTEFGGVFSESVWAAQEGAKGFWFQSFSGSPTPVDVELAQTVSNVAGGDYTLTFYAAREPGVTATSYIASLSSSGSGGSDTVDLLTAPFLNTQNMEAGGTQFSLSLTGVGAGDNLTVSVAMLGGVPGNDPQSLMVDNFNLDETIVPEPASLALMGLALLGAGTLRRKR